VNVVDRSHGKPLLLSLVCEECANMILHGAGTCPDGTFFAGSPEAEEEHAKQKRFEDGFVHLLTDPGARKARLIYG
jgi:hypothetical protein